jgi:hypothetical protein
MSLYFELGLIGILLSGKEKALTEESNPVMVNTLRSLGYGYVVDGGGDIAAVKERLYAITAALESRLAYYDSSEMLVNTPLNQYLGELLANAANGSFDPSKNVAMMICALGNKTSEGMSGGAVEEWLEHAYKRIQYFVEVYEGHEPALIEGFSVNIRQLEYADKILQLLDVFVTTRLGMLAGVEEFSPASVEDRTETDDPDFEIAEQCAQSDDCGCGCKLDHALTLLQGMEDLLNGRITYEAHYAHGVAMANNVRPFDAVTGTEGAVLDALKDLGEKAWEAIKESFSAIKELISPEEDKEKGSDAKDKADNNKKSLQAMEDKSAQINDAAKAGILALCDKADPSGEMKKAISGLNTAGDGPRTLDALLGVLNKEISSGSALQEAFKKGEKALADLKSANGKVSGADEKNKDVVAATKAQVNDKIAQAKEALKTARKEVGDHNKRVNAIVKAISGINEKIFSKKSYPADKKPKEAAAAKE